MPWAKKCPDDLGASRRGDVGRFSLPPCRSHAEEFSVVVVYPTHFTLHSGLLFSRNFPKLILAVWCICRTTGSSSASFLFEMESRLNSKRAPFLKYAIDLRLLTVERRRASSRCTFRTRKLLIFAIGTILLLYFFFMSIRRVHHPSKYVHHRWYTANLQYLLSPSFLLPPDAKWKKKYSACVKC